MNIETFKSEYRYNSHMTFSCKYHVIFCPKYRRNILTDEMGKRINELFNKIAKDCDAIIEDIEVLGDHIHLIVNCDPTFGITKVIRELKGKSSRILRTEFPILKRKLPTLWTRASFVSTVGSVSLDVVKKYIENQKGK